MRRDVYNDVKILVVDGDDVSGTIQFTKGEMFRK